MVVYKKDAVVPKSESKSKASKLKGVSTGVWSVATDASLSRGVSGIKKGSATCEGVAGCGGLAGECAAWGIGG